MQFWCRVGDLDHLASISEFRAFVEKMEEAGNDFVYRIFDVGHFFRNTEARAIVEEMTDEFLTDNGFLPAPSQGGVSGR